MAKFYVQLEDRLLQISGELTAENISKALGYVPADSSALNNYATKDEVSDLVDMSMVEDLSQRVDNISFDNLKDNPFLQDGSGELNIVDEAGNIIAKVNSEGIHSVDFIAGNHKLTDKIDSTALNGYAKESWVSAEIAKAATEGKIDLTGYATEEWVEGKNYLTEHQNISHLANKDEIPTKVSDLENDSNYITEHQDISHLATKDEISNIDFYNIKDNPIVNNGDGKLLFVDENGYIGLQLEEDGLYVKDVIADGHTLSQKADKSELSNYATKDEVSDLVDMSVVTELQGKVNTLVGEDVDKSVRDIAVDVLTETLVSETATEAYDTLAEMSDWIKSHPEDAAAMNTAIQKNAEDITNLDAAYKAADSKVLTDAQEYTDNINFYTIKDNPIVDGEAGSITFVDETGYIGLKVTEDGIIAKDVVTPEHTLSSKADKSFVEDNYYNKSTVDKKITEAVTGGQVSLDGFATEQWVNEQGFLKTHQDISHLAEKSELPKKVSDLENDKGYLTEHQDISHLATKSELPTKVSDLENDSKFITIDEVPEVTVPTKVSDLTNDSGFITLADVPVQEIPEEYITETELNSKGYLTEHQDISHLATKAELPTVPTKVSELENDKGFLTEHQDISHLASRNWVESQGYAHQEDLLEISFNDIQDSPISIDDSGMINFVDESGNVGFQINEEGLRVSEVIVGEHKLSEKANVSDIPSLDGYAKTEDLPDFSEFAKLENIPEVPSLDGYATEEWVNNKNYATEYDLKTIDFSSINNVPLNEDASGEFSIVDESGNVGMKVSSEDGIYVKDVIAGEHILSNKQDSLISGSNIKTINGESILGEGNIVVEGGQQDLSEYAKKSEIPTKVSRLENDANYIQDDIISNGVYAVDASGKLIDYTTADSTALGVALVAGEHKFMIAKSNATDGTNTTLYWGKNLYQKDVAGITNISSGADYIGEGKKYGTDFTTWSTGPVVDFNGAANTAAIIAGYTEHGVSMDARDMCTVLNTFNASDGYNDWYIPAAGQLALMYLAKTDINTALQNIGGTALESNFYWSSSEFDACDAWRVKFSSGNVDLYDKKGLFTRVRFVRDISIPKSLKERVSDLESKIKDLNTSGSSNGAYAEINHGTSDTTFTLTPNTFHVWDEVASLDLSFADEQAGVANEYLFQFTSGATATTLTLPDGLKWANEPTIAENMIYQVSVLKGLASVLEFNIPPALIENKATLSFGSSSYTVSFQYPVESDIVVKVRSGDGPITKTITSGEYSINLSPMGPMVDASSYIESLTPSSDSVYLYTF